MPSPSPNNLIATDSLRHGERQAYGKMLDAFYPYVATDGTIDLHSAAPEVDQVYEDLLGLGYAAPVVQFLAKKAVLDIPEMKSEIERLHPEDAGGDFGDMDVAA